jgi:hypothetical protein
VSAIRTAQANETANGLALIQASPAIEPRSGRIMTPPWMVASIAAPHAERVATPVEIIAPAKARSPV